MQWVSIYGDSQSSPSEILLNSWKRFMGLFLRCMLKVWVLLIKLPQGWRRSPLHRPVWPPHPAGTHGRLPALQHLASKVLRQLVFSSTWPFPLTLFSPSYLYSASTSHFFLQPPLVTHTPAETFQHFQCFLFPFVINFWDSCLYTCLCLVTFFQPIFQACFLLGQFVPLSRVTAKKKDRKERRHGNREQKQERKEGRVQALK